MNTKQKCSNDNQRKLTVDFVNSLKTPCAKCGESRKYVIDFHHIDPAKKQYGIGWGIKARGRKSLKKEIEKCICLCRNCHTEFHYLYGEMPADPEKDLKAYLEGGLNA